LLQIDFGMCWLILSCNLKVVCRDMGRTTLRLQDRFNQHIPKSIRNKQISTKILPKRKCEKVPKYQRFSIVTQQLGFISYKIKQTIITTNSFQFFARQEAHFISQHYRSYVHQNSQTYSMSLERIHPLIANFTLVGVHPALTIFHLCSALSSSAASNQSASACFNVTCAKKYHDILFSHSILAYSWRVLDENVRIY